MFDGTHNCSFYDCKYNCLFKCVKENHETPCPYNTNNKEDK